MKAADYRIPWGRPSEHLLAVKREIKGQQLHTQRVNDARNRSMVDSNAPECAYMPHLITRPKKQKMQEDRQREIAAENDSLMHRLAGIMREERASPVRKFAHLSMEYRESLRRKKLLKLETENRRLARSIKRQKPFYPTSAMEKEEEKRQRLLKTMSRTERRKERAALFATHADQNCRGGDFIGIGRGRNASGSHSSLDAAATARLVEDGVLFRPGPTTVPLRTAKQMQMEVARRRLPRGRSDGDDCDGIGSGNFSHQNDQSRHFDEIRGGMEEGQAGGGREGNRSSADSITVRRRRFSADGAMTEKTSNYGNARGVVLEMNRTGGRRRSGGSLTRRAATRNDDGRPNMIFTPSLVPAGMESVRASPMSLGSASRGGSVTWAGGNQNSDGSFGGGGEGGTDARGGEWGAVSRGGEGADVEEKDTLRDVRTV